MTAIVEQCSLQSDASLASTSQLIAPATCETYGAAIRMALETTDRFNTANIDDCIVENNGICSSEHYSACANFVNDFSSVDSSRSAGVYLADHPAHSKIGSWHHNLVYLSVCLFRHHYGAHGRCRGLKVVPLCF